MVMIRDEMHTDLKLAEGMAGKKLTVWVCHSVISIITMHRNQFWLWTSLTKVGKVTHFVFWNLNAHGFLTIGNFENYPLVQYEITYMHTTPKEKLIWKFFCFSPFASPYLSDFTDLFTNTLKVNCHVFCSLTFGPKCTTRMVLPE